MEGQPRDTNFDFDRVLWNHNEPSLTFNLACFANFVRRFEGPKQSLMRNLTGINLGGLFQDPLARGHSLLDECKKVDSRVCIRSPWTGDLERNDAYQTTLHHTPDSACH